MSDRLARGGVRLLPYEPAFEQRWNELVMASDSGTVLQSRRFLAYHGTRFNDLSVMQVDRASGQLLAVMPAARHPARADLVVSHPGSTFGGLIMRRPDPASYAAALESVLAHFRNQGLATLRLKTTPAFVGDQFDAVAVHHGLRHGELVRADLWNAIQLTSPYKLASSRRSDIKAALKRGLVCRDAGAAEDWAAFHAMLAANLQERHEAVPVHSSSELVDLNDRLGAASRLLLCTSAVGDLLAGVWLLDYGHRVLHTQYIASTVAGRAAHAVDVVLAHAIEQATVSGYRIFSFGINTESDGWSINADLLKYKMRFGAGTVLHHTFDYDLTA